MISGLRGSMRRHAEAAREEVERALDHAGRPWLRRLSLWLDAHVLLEEEEERGE